MVNIEELEVSITPVVVRDIYREALCALLGINTDCEDDELIASATELGKKMRGELNE